MANDVSRKQILEHFGYTESDVRQEGLWVGLWKVEDGILDKLRKLPDVLDEKQKVRIIFDYDPNFPRAVIRVTGVKGGSGPVGNGRGCPMGESGNGDECLPGTAMSNDDERSAWIQRLVNGDWPSNAGFEAVFTDYELPSEDRM